MVYEKIAQLSSADAGKANSAHYQIDDNIRTMMSDLSLADKMEVQKMVQEFCLKQSGK